MDQKVTYTFGPFRLETGSQLLRFENQSINLQPKVYGLLLYFLQNPGRLISHDELFKSVWRGRIVEDTALRLTVNALRKVLHDESKTPRYLLTVNKCGYRFLPEVNVNYGVHYCATANASCLHYHPFIGLNHGTEHYQEMQQLLDAFEYAGRGKRHLVFLNGERGTGKTALLDRFLAEIGQSGFGVLRARCVHLSIAAEPFLPLLEALERRCRDPNGQHLIDCLQKVAPTWLYQILNVLETEEINTLLTKVSHINSGRMIREGADLFETLGNESTFVLILDNSHWSDGFTLDLISFLGHRCSPAKLLVIVCYRTCDTYPGSLRLEQMREELMRLGLCRELSLRKMPVAEELITKPE